MSTRLSIETTGQLTFIASDDRILLGEGLFETLKVVNNNVCHSPLHWQRLQQAAAILEIPFDLSLPQWSKALNDCIHLNHLQEGGIKVTLSGGPALRGLLQKSNESHVIFTAFSYKKNTNPAKLLSSPWLRDANNPIYQVKSVNYLEAIMACRYAQGQGADDVLFFNTHYEAMETTIANLFAIQGKTLFTPSLNSGILPGITRQRIQNICHEQQIDCFEQSVKRQDLMQADALFLCNSLQGIRPVHSLDSALFNVHHPLIYFLQPMI